MAHSKHLASPPFWKRRFPLALNFLSHILCLVTFATVCTGAPGVQSTQQAHLHLHLHRRSSETLTDLRLARTFAHSAHILFRHATSNGNTKAAKAARTNRDIFLEGSLKFDKLFRSTLRQGKAQFVVDYITLYTPLKEVELARKEEETLEAHALYVDQEFTGKFTEYVKAYTEALRVEDSKSCIPNETIRGFARETLSQLPVEKVNTVLAAIEDAKKAIEGKDNPSSSTGEGAAPRT